MWAGMNGLLAGTTDPAVKAVVETQFAEAGLLGRHTQAPSVAPFDQADFDRRFGSPSDAPLAGEDASPSTQAPAQSAETLGAGVSPVAADSSSQISTSELANDNSGPPVDLTQALPEQMDPPPGRPETPPATSDPVADKLYADILAAKGHPKQFVNAFYRAGLYLGLNDTQARLMAAQATHESGAGKRAPGFNYFGIKAFKSWKGATQRLLTHEFEDGKLVPKRLLFRKYGSLGEGIQNRISVMKHNFPQAFNAKDIESALFELQHNDPKNNQKAYATDIAYIAPVRRYLKLIP